jgi:hypothetical protein
MKGEGAQTPDFEQRGMGKRMWLVGRKAETAARQLSTLTARCDKVRIQDAACLLRRVQPDVICTAVETQGTGN